MDLKKPLTFDEQLDKLIAHGMIVADREKAKDILKRVNYYRFTGYALQFRQEPSGSNYIEGTTFELIRPGQFYFDACYNPSKTAFLKNAEKKGCKILNGLGMSSSRGLLRSNYGPDRRLHWM